VVNGHSFILIRQMATLERHALVEVCTPTFWISAHQNAFGNSDGIMPTFQVEEVVGLFGGSKMSIFEAVWQYEFDEFGTR